MALLTENNRQYYEGAQGFRGDGTTVSFTTTFDTDLVFGAAEQTDVNYQKNNFKLYTSVAGTPGTWSEVVADYSVTNNIITFDTPPANNLFIVVQLKRLDGGKYGNTTQDKAYGSVVEQNYGSYAYTKLDDVINNFLIAYVGQDKLIPSVKRTDVIFHAKRAMQELSYDTLKAIKSQELNIPHNLSVVMPQDYVNYVNLYWFDNQGVKHIILPTDLTSNPYTQPLQDSEGIPLQDNFDNNTSGTSIAELRWKDNLLGEQRNIDNIIETWEYGYGWGDPFYGQQYGMDPRYANANGYFTINDREGKISFSANLVDKLITFEYISDGLSTDLDTKVPKLAEEAMYASILHAIISTRINQPEYIVQRLKKEKSAKIRNAKLRLSNIKLNELIQTMRGKSKWIKH